MTRVDIDGDVGAFREEVAAFLRDNWRAGKTDVAAFRQAAIDRGYLYRSVPRRYGGSEQAADSTRARVIREAFAKARAPAELEGPGVSMLVPTLLARGAEWQKEKFIAPTLRGEIIWCQGYSEPGSGSDLASLSTRGVLRDREWVINGQKVWTTLAHKAHYMFILVRTEPDAPKHKGISYLLMPMDQPGITVRPLRQMTGGSEFNEVFLDDARTKADWIVGERGEGWQVSRTTLKAERDLLGGGQRGEALFRKLVELARQSGTPDQPALWRAEIRQELARIEGYMLSQKYSGQRQAAMAGADQDPGLIGLLNKLNATEIGHRIAHLAQELIAEDGLSMPDPSGPQGSKWVNQIMGSLGIAIAGGTSNIQRNVIAERGLGLPREEGGERS